MLYLYGVWTERRKRSPKTEENEPLSNGSKTASDCEKGTTEEGENENVDDYVVRLLDAGLRGVLLTTTLDRFSYPSTERRYPGGTQLRILLLTTDLLASPNIRNLERSGPGYIRSTEPCSALPLPVFMYFSTIFCTIIHLQPRKFAAKHINQDRPPDPRRITTASISCRPSAPSIDRLTPLTCHSSIENA